MPQKIKGVYLTATQHAGEAQLEILFHVQIERIARAEELTFAVLLKWGRNLKACGAKAEGWL
jgi:hypothetical protein